MVEYYIIKQAKKANRRAKKIIIASMYIAFILLGIEIILLLLK
jgi:hypothetical protein